MENEGVMKLLRNTYHVNGSLYERMFIQTTISCQGSARGMWQSCSWEDTAKFRLGIEQIENYYTSLIIIKYH